jgi:hypothetical protein
VRTFLIKALLFAAVLVALDRAIFAGAMYLRDHSDYHEGVDLLYYKNWDPAVVFFGDSRTHLNFDMSVIEQLTGLSAYNFGINGDRTRENVFMIDQLFRNDHHPKVVVLEADAYSLGEDEGRFDTSSFQEYLATEPRPDAMFIPHDGISGRLARFATAWLMRSATIANRLPDLLAKWQIPPLPGGVSPFAEVCRRTPGHELDCAGYHGSDLVDPEKNPWAGDAKSGGAIGINPPQQAMFERVAALAGAHGAYLLLDQTPFYHTDEVFPPDVTAPVEQFYCELARRNAHVLYARLSHLDGVDDNRALYYDGWHFNADGALIMSQTIAPLIADLAHGDRPEPCVLR